MPPLDERYVNIVRTDERSNRIWICSEHQWQTDQPLFQSEGVYRLTVSANPIEGAPIKRRLGLQWTGHWHETDMWMINEENPESQLNPRKSNEINPAPVSYTSSAVPASAPPRP
jgi:hypothetical protein